MPFMRYATAKVIHPHVSSGQWGRVRVAGVSAKAAKGDLDTNLVVRASDIFDKKFDPEKYLLTHATIIASVDTVAPQGAKTGSVLEDGFRVDRKFSDYRVKPACDQFINNNMDCWSRPVILKSYQTFVGAHNFVEHVQIEEMSRGRIIDAVARDIGDSVYVDILIATDRKNRDLIAAIENGKMGTLSMGCTVDGTICTRCGHWAADETELCPHIKYSKGNVFFDEQGNKHRIAELCGHESIDPHGGVQFIEASWVGSPAFTGAVLRNILEPSEAVSKKAEKILSEPPAEWSRDKERKAATVGTVVRNMGSPRHGRVVLTAADDFLHGWEDRRAQDEGTGEEPKPVDQLVKDVHELVMDKVRKQVEEELKGDAVEDALTPENSTADGNTNLNKEARSDRAARLYARVYNASINAIAKSAKSDVAMVDALAGYHQQLGIGIPVHVYRAALKVGAHRKYGSLGDFRAACDRALGRKPTLAEAKTILRIGKLLSRRLASGGSDVSHQGGSEC